MRFAGCATRVNQRWEEVKDYHGDISFDASNQCAGSPNENGGYDVFTENGEDAESVSYIARFTNGKLQEIREEGRSRTPARPMKEFSGGE